MLQPAQQHRDFDPLRPGIGVRLIQADELQVARLKDGGVLRTNQQILEHRVVSEKNVRRTLLHLFTR